MRYSSNIRKNLEHLKIFFNEEAVVILTRRDIPVQVKFVLSLGKSFNFCKPISASPMIDLFICMEKIMLSCNRYEELFNVKHQFNSIKGQFFSGKLTDDKPTESQLYIYELMEYTAEFLRRNNNIVVIPADKGGKIVIMDREEYVKKAESYLKGNVIAGNYELVHSDFLSIVRPGVEKDYVDVISVVNPFLMIDRTLKEPLKSEPFMIPLFYGCPKIHKSDVPLRPIIAAVDMIGNFLSTWLLGKLQLITNRLNKYNVMNSVCVIPDLKSFKLEQSHRLCSFDYVSMFTNVDVDETLLIITEHYDAISETTSVPLEVFMKCLRFFTKCATFFMFNENIYKQVKGLAMGNRLAQVLAEIKTNYALRNALKNFGAEVISFIFKYVDDIFTSIHEDYITLVKNEISTCVRMELTLTNEDHNSEVEFLDCTFKRNEDCTISSRWLKKSFSCLSILNFHSYHPPSMKFNVAIEMIRKAYLLTSPEFLEQTKELLANILKRSSYPEHFIIENLHVNLPNDIKNVRLKEAPNGSRYISCPYFDPFFNIVKSVISENGMNLKLAPMPSSSNKRILFSRIKDFRDRRTIKNAIFKMECKNCEFIHLNTTKGSDIQRTIQSLINDHNSPCAIHILEFPDHQFKKDVKIIKSFYDEYDVKQSRSILGEIRKYGLGELN